MTGLNGEPSLSLNLNVKVEIPLPELLSALTARLHLVASALAPRSRGVQRGEAQREARHSGCAFQISQLPVEQGLQKESNLKLIWVEPRNLLSKLDAVTERTHIVYFFAVRKYSASIIGAFACLCFIIMACLD